MLYHLVQNTLTLHHFRYPATALLSTSPLRRTVSVQQQHVPCMIACETELAEGGLYSLRRQLRPKVNL